MGRELFGEEKVVRQAAK
jgi:exonuclease VII large subunit